MFFDVRQTERLISITPEPKDSSSDVGKTITFKHYHECDW